MARAPLIPGISNDDNPKTDGWRIITAPFRLLGRHAIDSSPDVLRHHLATRNVADKASPSHRYP